MLSLRFLKSQLGACFNASISTLIGQTINNKLRVMCKGSKNQKKNKIERTNNNNDNNIHTIAHKNNNNKQIIKKVSLIFIVFDI